MGIVVEVMEKVYSEGSGNSVLLQLPDSTPLRIGGREEGELDQLHVGNRYTLAFVPFVTVPGSPAIAVDHPTVIDPTDPTDAAKLLPTIVEPVAEPVQAAAAATDVAASAADTSVTSPAGETAASPAETSATETANDWQQSL